MPAIALVTAVPNASASVSECPRARYVSDDPVRIRLGDLSDFDVAAFMGARPAPNTQITLTLTPVEYGDDIPPGERPTR